MKKGQSKKGGQLSGRGKNASCVKVYDLTGASLSRIEEINNEKEMWRDLVGKLYVRLMEREVRHVEELMAEREKLREQLEIFRNHLEKEHETLLEIACNLEKTKTNQTEPNLTND